MDCQKTKEYLYPFLDGQLDDQTNLLVKEHLESCPLCSLEWKQEKKFDSLIRQNISCEKAAFSLRETVLNRIEQTQELRPLPFTFYHIRPAIATILAVLIIAIVTIPSILKKPEGLPVFSASILSHTKFLQGALPIELASNNPNQIKNWFQGKLDFALNIPDLSSKGANLVGARLCHLREREAAYLIYEKNGHYISVFVINAKGLSIPKAKKTMLDEKTFYLKSEKGYQSILCLEKGGDIGCIFVSDLPEDELMKIIA